MDQYKDRQRVKAFGQLINDDFYRGKEDLFPFNRFFGYHAGMDLEAFSNEKDSLVPVYAVSSGTITYIGSLSGYGGIILEKLDGENATGLYGHVKTGNMNFKVGDHVTVADKPVVLTYLGDAFSRETSKERKHLHFGMYKGADLYFRGHEENHSLVLSRWYDPTEFLKQRNAKDPLIVPSIPTTVNIKSETKVVEKKTFFFYTILNWIRQLLKHE